MNIIQNIIDLTNNFLGGYTTRKFRTNFGVTPEIVATILLLSSTNQIKLKHLLWTLYF